MKNIQFKPIVIPSETGALNKFHNKIKKKRSIKNNPKKNETKSENPQNNNIQRCPKQKNLFISIAIILLLGLISTIVIVIMIKITKKRKNNNNIDENNIDKNNLDDKNLDEILVENILEESNLDKDDRKPIDIIPLKVEPIIIPTFSYQEAESIMNFEIIKNNHFILNETIENINNLLLISENSTIELKELNSEISFNIPDFLKNPTKPALKIVKSDIELYKLKFEELIYESNNHTKTITEYLKNISFILNNTKEELNKIIYQYEEIIKNLSIPIFLEQKYNINMTYNESEKDEHNLRVLSINYQMEEYKNKIDELNQLYNKLFNYFNEETRIIGNEINEIPNLLTDLQNQIKDGISQYEQTLIQIKESDNIQTMHSNLINTKSSFISLKNDMNNKQNELIRRANTFQNEYRDRRNNFEESNNDYEAALDNLNVSSYIIINEIIEERQKYNRTPIEIPNLQFASIVTNSIINSLDRIVEIITREEIRLSNGIEIIISLINVEQTTSLDLLFVMDITGSMVPYLEQAKQNVINIINKIILECPGIDINLGFIGYRDIYEINKKDYVDIDFTKDYLQLQNSIKKVNASGGADGPEDVAWAMEMSLNKNWKNNARFVILIADAPCHGKKYHSLKYDSYPDGIPNRKNIEELIGKMAENNISLFCMKITSLTDIMYSTFENIYNNYEKCEFRIVSMNSGQNLSDIVVNSAAEVYIFQRNVEFRK